MKTFRASCAVVLFGLLGCGGGGSNPPTAADFCTQYAKAICSISAACAITTASCEIVPDHAVHDDRDGHCRQRQAGVRARQHEQLPQQGEGRVQRHGPHHAEDAGGHRPRLWLRVPGDAPRSTSGSLYDPVRLRGRHRRLDHLRRAVSRLRDQDERSKAADPCNGLGAVCPQDFTCSPELGRRVGVHGGRQAGPVLCGDAV